jgi:hypothetical protein
LSCCHACRQAASLWTQLGSRCSIIAVHLLVRLHNQDQDCDWDRDSDQDQQSHVHRSRSGDAAHSGHWPVTEDGHLQEQRLTRRVRQALAYLLMDYCGHGTDDAAGFV